MATDNQDKVLIDQLIVQPDRIEAHVRIEDEQAKTTTPQLIAAALQEFPTIACHACRNHSGPTFAAVMENTSTAHLLEHLIIDAQTRATVALHFHKTNSEQVVFTGNTQQSAEDANVSIVRVSFQDDLIALEAFKKALNFINKYHSP